MIEPRHVPERRQSEIDGTSSAARLQRIEEKLDILARRQDRAEDDIRDILEWRRDVQEWRTEVQKWRTEMTVYFRQLRWVALAVGATFFGVLANIALELAKRT